MDVSEFRDRAIADYERVSRSFTKIRSSARWFHSR